MPEENVQDSSALPEKFFVHNMVRRIETRRARAASPRRHRFKQYLFGDPSRRLVRSRPLAITRDELVKHIEELRRRRREGLIEVKTPDGRFLDLETLNIGRAAPVPQQPHPPLDSVENDRPAGVMASSMPGGMPYGDPAAARSAQKLGEEKLKEAEGADEPPSHLSQHVPSQKDVDATGGGPSLEESESVQDTEPPPTEEAPAEPVAEELSGDPEPAAEEPMIAEEEPTEPKKRSSKRFSKKGRSSK